MSRFSWLFAPGAEQLSFAIRCCVSVALSLYLAFWLQLDNAYWVFINVAILIQPLPGFLVVRGFARLLGTFVAGIMGIVLIALFAQSYTLFSVGLIAWVGAMVFCASLFRNNMSYGFVLAGYVTAIIGVRAMTDPTAVFSISVARTAETALAAVVAAFVSVLLAPSTTAKKYFQARIKAFKAIGAQIMRLDRDPDVRHADAGKADVPHSDLQDLVETTLELEKTRQYARFDEPGFAEYDRLARRLDYELLALVSAMASLQVYLSKFAHQVDRAPLRELDHAAKLLSDDPNNTAIIKRAFSQAYSRILAMARDGSPEAQKRSLVDWVIISRAMDMANRMRAAVIKHGNLIAERGSGRHGVSSSNEFRTPIELRESIRTTVRAAVAMSMGAAIWSTHAEPALAGMMVLLSVLTTLFALGDDPVGGARGFGIAGLCAGVAAFFVNFVFLPHATSFAMLMLVLLPVVFVAGLAMITPAYALIGRVGLVVFALLVHPGNSTRQSFVAFAETLMGAELAVILALVAFTLVLPTSPRRLLRERLAGIFGELSKGFTGAREHFETRVYDRLLRLPVAADKGETHVSARQAAFSAVNMGLEARSLRILASRASFSASINEAVRQELQALEALFEHGLPEIEQVLDRQVRANRLALNMLEEGKTFNRRQQRRLGIRAAVAAELVAAALADYALARENSDAGRIELGEPNRVS
ncbi:MAG: FUSC family protein [Salinisphaera sp.]|nr:FUSC family protein [Salinisphaera sp.]